jgi:hypothetical protein
LTNPSIVETACPEKRLLIYCARVNAQPDFADKIRELASGPRDWEYIFSDAVDNSLIPLLHLHLSAVATDKVPSVQMDRLKAAALRNTAQCLLLTAELIRVMDALGSRGIAAVPYKGPVLAVHAYGDIALRQFEDLDIILRQVDLPVAHELMLGLGYRAKFPWILSADVPSALVPGDYIYIHEVHHAMVELHTERSMRHFPVPPSLEKLGRNLVSVSLSGHEIETFAAEDALAILCVHGSKHFWEKLSWIADISEMIRSHPGLEWSRAYQRAESLRAQRMLNVGLALAADLLATALPEEIGARIKKDRVAVELAAEIERYLLIRELPPLSAAARFRLRRKMVQGAIAGWSYAVRLATAPAEEDWEMVRLPAALAPLYIALRPIRLLRKYGGKH